MADNLESFLGPMSPLTSYPANSNTSSLSFNKATQSMLASDAMSTDTLPPIDKLQAGFEFKPASDPVGPFSSRAFKDTMKATDQSSSRMPATPVTPASVTADSAAPATLSASDGTAKRAFGAVLLWERPILSLGCFASGLLVLAAMAWTLWGNHNITLVSGTCYLLLADLGWNFVRYFLFWKFQEAHRWVGSSATKWAAEQAVAAVNAAARLHDSYLSGVDPHVTLRIAAGLWALAWLGSVASLWTLVPAAYIAAFTLPPLYTARRTQAYIKTSLVPLYAKAGASIAALEMPRTTRLAATLAALALLFFVATRAQFAIGIFVALTYWRTTLVAHEVEAIRAAAEPYTQSVRKAGRRLSIAVDDVMVRYSSAPRSRTRSHFRQ